MSIYPRGELTIAPAIALMHVCMDHEHKEYMRAFPNDSFVKAFPHKHAN